MVGRVEAMARLAKAPLIADGDTGYGGLLNVRHTVRGYEQAGAAAIQLEDQDFPKKCGHTPERRVIPTEEMVRKIAVAVEARTSPDFLIIARTDARTSLGSQGGHPARARLRRSGRGHAVHRVAGIARTNWPRSAASSATCRSWPIWSRAADARRW